MAAEDVFKNYLTQNFQDRKATQLNRYTITPDPTKEGSYFIARDNGEITVDGTPLNAETFNDMDADLAAAINSIIVGLTSGNVQIGEGANAKGGHNVAIGTLAMRDNDTGINNIAIGRFTLMTNVSNSNNIAIGYEGLKELVSGNSNVAIGWRALLSLKEGDGNVAIGYSAFNSATVSENNVAIGRAALRDFSSTDISHHNTAIGFAALRGLTSGFGNIGIGHQAMQSSSGGAYSANIGIGQGALTVVTTNGDHNVSIGNLSMTKNTTGNHNIAAGSSALSANTTGSNNIAIGPWALAGGTTSTNIAIGYYSLNKLTVSAGHNVAVGVHSQTAATTGVYNVSLGNSTLRSITTGKYNVAVGADAMQYSSVDGERNVAVGYQALRNGQGNMNIAIGVYAGENAKSSGNIMVGYQAGQVIGHNNNIAIGDGSLKNAAYTEGCVCVGSNTLYNTTNASNLTAIGHQAGIALGGQGYSNSVCLGANSTVTGSNQIQLGSPGTTPYAYGSLQQRSDRRDKTDIQKPNYDMGEFLRKIDIVQFRWNLREDYRFKSAIPEDEYSLIEDEAERAQFLEHEVEIETPSGELEKIKFYYKIEQGENTEDKARKRLHAGVIAQQVKEVMDEMGIDFAGYQDHSVNGGEDVLSIAYESFVPLLIKSYQDMHEEQEKRYNELLETTRRQQEQIDLLLSHIKSTSKLA